MERFFRSLKVEYVYLNEHKKIKEVKTGIANYLKFYNYVRLHEGLKYNIAWEIYNEQKIVYR